MYSVVMMNTIVLLLLLLYLLYLFCLFIIYYSILMFYSYSTFSLYNFIMSAISYIFLYDGSFTFLCNSFLIFIYILLIILYFQILLLFFYKSILDFENIKGLILHMSIHYVSTLFCCFFILFMCYLSSNFIIDVLYAIDGALFLPEEKIESPIISDTNNIINNHKKKKTITLVDYDINNKKSDRTKFSSDVIIITTFVFILS